MAQKQKLGYHKITYPQIFTFEDMTPYNGLKNPHHYVENFSYDEGWTYTCNNIQDVRELLRDVVFELNHRVSHRETEGIMHNKEMMNLFLDIIKTLQEIIIQANDELPFN